MTNGRALARLAQGSIGRALDLAGAGGARSLSHPAQIPSTGCPSSMRWRCTPSPISSPAPRRRTPYRTITELLTQWLARMIRTAAGGRTRDDSGEIVRASSTACAAGRAPPPA